MARTPKDVTDTEFSILHFLCETGRATVRELAEKLYPGRAAAQHTTVQKLLERLQAKGCVTHDRATWPYTFLPSIRREDLIERQIQQMADKLCDGSLQPVLSHLVKAGRLTSEDRQALRSLLDELNGANENEAKENEANEVEDGI